MTRIFLVSSMSSVGKYSGPDTDEHELSNGGLDRRKISTSGMSSVSKDLPEGKLWPSSCVIIYFRKLN